MLPVSAKQLVRWSPRANAEKALADAEAAIGRLTEAAAEPAAADSDGGGDLAVAIAVATAHRDAAARLVDLEAEAPVYLVAVPTRAQRVDFKWAVKSAGLSWPADDVLREAAREAIVQALPEDDPDRVTWCELIARLVVAENEGVAPAPEDGAAWDTLSERLRRALPAYAALLADRERFTARVPDMAVAMFLRGQANPPRTYERVADRLTDDELDRLPPHHVQHLGWHIVNVLMKVGAETAKN